MFEITADDIALLNDDDLRSLVGRLCESEARRRGLPTSCVTWGGNQNAADGGLDVRVALPPDTAIDGFVPRAATGFQVKKPDMPRTAILAEMRPAGVLRPAIQELADKCGAYIIVSSTGSTSDAALQSRRLAMAEAASDLHNRSSLTLDFYDRTRLATWVRDHPGLIPWVRTKIGETISGWSSYGPWAYAPDGISGDYLLDEKLRIQTGRNGSAGGVSALEGMKQIRDLLREPGKVARLVGLSGVGKTRLVQALFDDRVGEKTLDPSLAVYANMADEPDPQPTGLVSDLIAERARAIVVIDNCPPDLHRRISELCRLPESTVSAVTIEYDIREDEPEGTDVFTLEPSSIELIENLVKRRFPTLSAVDSRTIAEFSGGNARIAIALAHTVGKNEKITGLSDEELFQRLFQQRHAPDESLLSAAQACSLVYSFQGEDTSNDGQAELVRLGAMIGKTAEELFRSVAELRRRDLVQQRGVWRAVLPHAIANRLASLALQNIPFATIEKCLTEGMPERLLKSFSRRLGYLHDSKEAVAIVEKWLASDGPLGNAANLNEVGKAMFNNVAPVLPEAALAALERALLGPEGDEAVSSCAYYVRLIRSLAYDAALFERCIALLLKFAQAAADDGKGNDGRGVFVSFFFLYLSGTHATIEQRLSIIEGLLLSDEVRQRELGLKAFTAALEAWHFSSNYPFEFGARSRDHGYWPRSGGEVKHWFGSILKLALTFASSDRPAAPLVRAAVAGNFRGLWTMAHMYDELEHVCDALSGDTFWPDGWRAVRMTLKFDSAGLKPDLTARLSSLEKRLRPKDLVQRVRALVLSEDLSGLDFDDFDDKGANDLDAEMRRTAAIARALGNAVAADEGILGELLAELVSGSGRHLMSFGQGLLEGTPDPKALWRELVAGLAATVERTRNVQILFGFLNAAHEKDPQLADAFLDDAVQDETLAAWYPMLQGAVRIDKRGVDRLKSSLALGKTPIARYQSLAWGRATDPISGQDLKELVLTIAAKPDGFGVAVEILQMRLHSDKEKNQGHAPETIVAGRELLRRLTFTMKNDREHRDLGRISKSCLVGEDGAAVTRKICSRLKDSVSKYETRVFDHSDLLQGLFSVQPAAALDGLCAGDAAELKRGIRLIEQIRSYNKNPLDAVPDNELFGWCDQEPAARYPAVAAAITISSSADETGPRWTNRAIRLLEKAPDRVAVLKQFIRLFRPTSWSGSRATIMASNAKLLDELEEHQDPVVAEFVAQEKVRFAKEIEAERRAETLEDRAIDERFE